MLSGGITIIPIVQLQRGWTTCHSAQQENGGIWFAAKHCVSGAWTLHKCRMGEGIHKGMRFVDTLFLQKHWVWSFTFFANLIYKELPHLICIWLINDEYLFPYVIPSYLSSKEIVFLRSLTVYLLRSLGTSAILWGLYVVVVICIAVFILSSDTEIYICFPYKFNSFRKDCLLTKKNGVIEICLTNV